MVQAMLHRLSMHCLVTISSARMPLSRWLCRPTNQQSPCSHATTLSGEADGQSLAERQLQASPDSWADLHLIRPQLGLQALWWRCHISVKNHPPGPGLCLITCGGIIVIADSAILLACTSRIPATPAAAAAAASAAAHEAQTL